MKSRLIAVAALAILMIPALSAAVSSRPGPYVSGFIGVSIPSDTDVTSYDFPDNETFNLKTAVGFRYPIAGSNLRASAGFKTGNIFL